MSLREQRDTSAPSARSIYLSVNANSILSAAFAASAHISPTKTSSELAATMKLVEPYKIYFCTQCNAVHISGRTQPVEDNFDDHVRFADSHGVVNRSELIVNDTLHTALMVSAFVSGSLLMVAGSGIAISKLLHYSVTVPGFSAACKWIACLFFVSFAMLWAVGLELPRTFGPSPWRESWGPALRAHWRELLFGAGFWAFLFALIEMPSPTQPGHSDSFLLRMLVAEVACIVMALFGDRKVFPLVKTHVMCFFSASALLILSFRSSTSLGWTGAIEYAALIAAVLVIPPLALILFARAFVFFGRRFLVAMVRVWRSAERLADEEQPKHL